MNGRKYGRTGYSTHAKNRVAQRWSGHVAPPTEHDWSRALQAPPRWAKRYGYRGEKGRRCMVTRDAMAVVGGDTVITVIRVGVDAVDNLRAIMLCRAMGLDVGFE